MFGSAKKSRVRFGEGVENLERREVFSASPLAELAEAATPTMTASSPEIPACEVMVVDSFFDVFFDIEVSYDGLTPREELGNPQMEAIGSSGEDGVHADGDTAPLTICPDAFFAYSTLKWGANSTHAQLDGGTQYFFAYGTLKFGVNARLFLAVDQAFTESIQSSQEAQLDAGPADNSIDSVVDELQGIVVLC